MQRQTLTKEECQITVGKTYVGIWFSNRFTISTETMRVLLQHNFYKIDGGTESDDVFFLIMLENSEIGTGGLSRKDYTTFYLNLLDEYSVKIL